GRSGVARTRTVVRRPRCLTTSVSPAATLRPGLPGWPLTVTAPASHISCATLRRGTRRLYLRNRSRRIRRKGSGVREGDHRFFPDVRPLIPDPWLRFVAGRRGLGRLRRRRLVTRRDLDVGLRAQLLEVLLLGLLAAVVDHRERHVVCDRVEGLGRR